MKGPLSLFYGGGAAEARRSCAEPQLLGEQTVKEEGEEQGAFF